MSRLIVGTVGLLLVAQWAQAKDDTPPNLIAGKPVPADAKLNKGDKLVGVWEKKNYLIEIVEVRRNNRLKVIWGGEPYDDIKATDLYYIGDSTPTRKKRTSPLPETYRQLDKNGDGQIGLYEWDRSKFAEFKKLDKNHDGLITPQELAEKPSIVASTPSEPASVKEAESKPESTEAAEVGRPAEAQAQELVEDPAS